MAAITHRQITYTTSNGAPTINVDLPLWAGSDQDETLWLKGNSTDAYPGNLSGFTATNSQVAERRQPRLVSMHIASGMADTNTLTLSGECSKILSCIAQRADATANIAIVKTSDLVLTFDMESTADGTTDYLTAMELWPLVV